MRDVTVLLSDKTWNVVLGFELVEMKVASIRGPPKRLVLKESPYCNGINDKELGISLQQTHFFSVEVGC